jgi:hypothetical protein
MTRVRRKVVARASVDREIVIYDELPPPSARSGGGRSVLNEQLETVKENPQAWGKPVRIGLYTQGTAATAAKNVLQQRFGRSAAVCGWKFYTRPVPVDTSPDADVLRGLFVVYTPDAVVDGALEAHELAEKKRIAELEAARAQRAAEADEEGEDLEFSDEEEAEGEYDEDDDDEATG